MSVRARGSSRAAPITLSNKSRVLVRLDLWPREAIDATFGRDCMPPRQLQFMRLLVCKHVQHASACCRSLSRLARCRGRRLETMNLWMA